MEITYENHGDYYTFSNDPEARVYLGDVPPEDYIHDVQEQAKRTASCYYYEIKTGKKVDKEIAYASHDLIWHGPSHRGDKEEDYTYGFKCDYDFKRKTSLASYHVHDRTVSYNQKDPAMERLATAYAFGQSLEEYDKRKKEFQDEMDEFARKNPSITNLMMVGGRPPYYVDDEGNEISSDKHIELMKAKYGDDVFDLERERLERETPEEVKQMIKEMMENRSDRA